MRRTAPPSGQRAVSSGPSRRHTHSSSVAAKHAGASSRHTGRATRGGHSASNGGGVPQHPPKSMSPVTSRNRINIEQAAAPSASLCSLSFLRETLQPSRSRFMYFSSQGGVAWRVVALRGPHRPRRVGPRGPRAPGRSHIHPYRETRCERSVHMSGRPRGSGGCGVAGADVPVLKDAATLWRLGGWPRGARGGARSRLPGWSRWGQSPMGPKCLLNLESGAAASLNHGTRMGRAGHGTRTGRAGHEARHGRRMGRARHGRPHEARCIMNRG